MRENWNSTLKVFVTETQICYSFHNFFDVVGQTSKSTFKTFGNMRQKCQSLFEFLNNITQVCISPNFFSTFWDKINSQLFRHCETKLFFTSELFRAVGKICNSTLKNLSMWVKNVSQFIIFPTLWEKIEIQLSKFSSLRHKYVIPFIIFSM